MTQVILCSAEAVVGAEGKLIWMSGNCKAWRFLVQITKDKLLFLCAHQLAYCGVLHSGAFFMLHLCAGAPAKVAGPAHNYEENDQLCGEKPTVRRLVETAVPQSKIKPTVGVQTRMQAMPEGATTSLPSSGGPLPAANPVAAGPSQGGSSQGPRQKLINVSGILAASPSLLSRDPRPRPVPNLALPASGTVQSLCNLQQLMSSVQSNSSQAL